MESILDKIGGPAAVILDAAKRLPRRLPEDELGEDALACAIERRILRVAARSYGLRWTSAEEVAAALDAGADVLPCTSEAEALATQRLADASIRFLPGITPQISCALSSAVSAVREGLHMWHRAQRESAERMLTRGLMRLREVDVKTSAEALLARDVYCRVWDYLDEDLGDVLPSSIDGLLRDVGELSRNWVRLAIRGDGAEVDR